MVQDSALWKSAAEAVKHIQLCAKGSGKRLVLNLEAMRFNVSKNDYCRPNESSMFWACSQKEAVICLARPNLYQSAGILLKMALWRLEQDLKDLLEARGWRVQEGRLDKLPRIDSRAELLRSAIERLQAEGAKEAELPHLPDYNAEEAGEDYRLYSAIEIPPKDY